MIRFPLVTLTVIGSAIGAVAFAAPDMPPPKEDPPARSAESGRQCFFANSVNGFTRAGKDAIYVHTGPRSVYLFEVAACPDINFSQRLALESIGGGTICDGLDVTLIVPSIAGAQKCPVRMIRKLSQDEVAEMRGKRR